LFQTASTIFLLKDYLFFVILKRSLKKLCSIAGGRLPFPGTTLQFSLL
jgi:hypothetical protein